jgi:hypothetical protein
MGYDTPRRVIRILAGVLLCCVAVVTGVVVEADADASLRDALARALEANERLSRLVEELREELARRDAELERVNAELAVLQRLVFGPSSERARPGAAGRDEDAARLAARHGPSPPPPRWPA